MVDRPPKGKDRTRVVLIALARLLKERPARITHTSTLGRAGTRVLSLFRAPAFRRLPSVKRVFL